jgi:hypothetical protein
MMILTQSVLEATMTIKPAILAVTSLCVASFMTLAHADIYYSNPSSNNNNGGYSSSGSSPTPSYPAHDPHGRGHNKYVSISVNVPPPSPPPYAGRPHYPHTKGLQWIDRQAGLGLPANMVVGGHQPNPPYTLFVCRGYYQGGMHPGKLVGHFCNIGWGGGEIRLSQYQVLVSRAPLGWAPVGNGGFIPRNALDVGYENGRTLYACQMKYRGGVHPGKVVDNYCHIGWGGKEIATPIYNVLVR